MANPKKSFSSLPTDAVELTKICGITAPTWIKWKYREDIVDIFKKYNRARGKVTKDAVICKLMKIPKDEYSYAINNLIKYVENLDVTA